MVATWLLECKHHIHEMGRNWRECLPDESVPFTKLFCKLYQKLSTCLSLAGKCSLVAPWALLNAFGEVEKERSCLVGSHHLCQPGCSGCGSPVSLWGGKYRNEVSPALCCIHWSYAMPNEELRNEPLRHWIHLSPLGSCSTQLVWCAWISLFSPVSLHDILLLLFSYSPVRSPRFLFLSQPSNVMTSQASALSPLPLSFYILSAGLACFCSFNTPAGQGPPGPGSRLDSLLAPGIFQGLLEGVQAQTALFPYPRLTSQLPLGRDP